MARKSGAHIVERQGHVFTKSAGWLASEFDRGALLQCGSAARESRLERRPDAAVVTHMKHNNVGWRCWEESD